MTGVNHGWIFRVHIVQVGEIWDLQCRRLWRFLTRSGTRESGKPELETSSHLVLPHIPITHGGTPMWLLLLFAFLHSRKQLTGCSELVHAAGWAWPSVSGRLGSGSLDSLRSEWSCGGGFGRLGGFPLTQMFRQCEARANFSQSGPIPSQRPRRAVTKSL